jgi:hypothetical protein
MTAQWKDYKYRIAVAFNVDTKQVDSTDNFLICILEIIISNLDRSTYYPVKCFS